MFNKESKELLPKTIIPVVHKKRNNRIKKWKKWFKNWLYKYFIPRKYEKISNTICKNNNNKFI